MTSRNITGYEVSVEQVNEHSESPYEGCPECEGTFKTVQQETVCSECGLIVEEDRLDRGPEWRSFDADERKRTGAPLTPVRHDRGLSTEIGYQSGGGKSFSRRKQLQLGRMRREQNRGRWRSKAERNLAHGLTDIRRITGALELPSSIRDQACVLFRSAQQEELLRGRSIEAFTAGAVYAVCRCNGFSRTLEEVAQYGQCELSRVKNAYKVLNSELELPTKPPVPQDYIPRFTSELMVSKAVQAEAHKFAKQAEEQGLVNGHKPSGVAAACIYHASQEAGEQLTQEEVGAVAGVSVLTVRSNWKRLVEFFD